MREQVFKSEPAKAKSKTDEIDRCLNALERLEAAIPSQHFEIRQVTGDIICKSNKIVELSTRGTRFQVIEVVRELVKDMTELKRMIGG